MMNMDLGLNLSQEIGPGPMNIHGPEAGYGLGLLGLGLSALNDGPYFLAQIRAQTQTHLNRGPVHFQ